MADLEVIDRDKFRVGEVLSKSFAILFRNIVPFGVAGLIAVGIEYILILGLGLTGTVEAIDSGEISIQGSGLLFVVSFLGLVLLGIVIISVLASVITKATLRALEGQPLHMRQSCRDAMPHVLRVVLTGAVFAILAMIGFALLFVPGLIVVTMLILIVPAVVIEGHGVGGALRRSAELTRYFRWKVFGVLAVVTIILQVLQTPFMLLPAALESVFVTAVAAGIVEAFGYVAWSVVATVMYHDLRLAKGETIATDVLAVFE